MMDLQQLQEMGQRERDRRKPVRIRCCIAAGCQSAGSLGVHGALGDAVKAAHLEDQVEVARVGCMGFCGRGPLVSVDGEQSQQLYEGVTPDLAPSIVGTVQGQTTPATPGNWDHPFFTRQLLIARENSGRIDPERIEDYIAVGGYQQLYRVLHDLSPEEVVKEMSASGLRGRGGGGYPTGLKWATVAKMPGGQKYVICNADEGDPGAYMDRSMLESDPHRILEGMAIAAYAIGANHGYVYVRAEYPLAIAHLQTAIKQAKRLGILGSQIFETDFDFKVDIRVGAGAFVCGEETALIASIEGKRGNPRPRPPYPAQSGLQECPTLINNVETFANVAVILREGSAWYASIGTEKSKGTKVFALTGNVVNTGLIEVPMGMTVRCIVEEMGGGVPGGRQVKAVQTGGPSGGCIPAHLFDTPVDYDSLLALGTMMGSGGAIVIDDGTDMVDVARFYMDFCRSESCGKCVPCRAGTVQMYALLDRILEGQATAQDLAALERLCVVVKDTSLCGLGISAPNPVISTLRYFRHEYESRLRSPIAVGHGD